MEQLQMAWAEEQEPPCPQGGAESEDEPAESEEELAEAKDLESDEDSDEAFEKAVAAQPLQAPAAGEDVQGVSRKDRECVPPLRSTPPSSGAGFVHVKARKASATQAPPHMLKRSGSAAPCVHDAKFKTGTGGAWKLPIDCRFGEGVYCSDGFRKEDLSTGDPPVDAKHLFAERSKSVGGTRSATFKTGAGGAWKLPPGHSSGTRSGSTPCPCEAKAPATFAMNRPRSATDFFKERDRWNGSTKVDAQRQIRRAPALADNGNPYVDDNPKKLLEGNNGSPCTCMEFRDIDAIARLDRKLKNSPSSRPQSPAWPTSALPPSRPRSALSTRMQAQPLSPLQSPSKGLNAARSPHGTMVAETAQQAMNLAPTLWITQLVSSPKSPSNRPNSASRAKRPRCFEREPDLRGMPTDVVLAYSSPDCRSPIHQKADHAASRKMLGRESLSATDALRDRLLRNKRRLQRNADKWKSIAAGRPPSPTSRGSIRRSRSCSSDGRDSTGAEGDSSVDTVVKTLGGEEHEASGMDATSPSSGQLLAKRTRWKRVTGKAKIFGVLGKGKKVHEADSGLFEEREEEAAADDDGDQELTSRRSSKSPTMSQFPLPQKDEEQALMLFARMARQGEISCDDVVVTLRKLGYTRPLPCKDHVMHIIDQMFHGRSFLERSEYIEFVRTYHNGYWVDMNNKFKEADLDNDGSIDAGELTSFLRKQGITPFPDAVRDILHEVVGTSDCSGRIGPQEFVHVLDIVHDRAGFSLPEIAKLKASLSRYDLKGQGTLEKKKAFSILSALGLAFDREQIEAIVENVLNDSRSGVLVESEYFVLVRRCREEVLADMRARFNRRAYAGQHEDEHVLDALIGKETLLCLLSELGHPATTSCLLEEVATSCKMEKQEHFTFEDVVLLVDGLRDTGGFCAGEREDIINVFSKFQEEFSDGISGRELLRAVHWFGYPATVQQVRDAVLDLDINDALEESDFLRILARFRNMEVSFLRAIFKEAELTAVEDMRNALAYMGFSRTGSHVSEFLQRNGGEDRQVALWEMDRLAVQFRHEARDRLRANHGFHDGDADELRRLFQKYDQDNTGFLSHGPLRSIVEEKLPGVRTDMAQHKAAAKILQRADTDGNKKVNFQEFVYMMRLIHTHLEDANAELEKGNFTRERRAASASRFTAQEVKDFRAVFKQFDSDESGDIDHTEFEEMVAVILGTKGTGAHEDIKALIAAVDEDQNEKLDFPEFLIVMRKVLDEDWKGVKSATTGAAKA